MATETSYLPGPWPYPDDWGWGARQEWIARLRCQVQCQAGQGDERAFGVLLLSAQLEDLIAAVRSLGDRDAG